MASQAQDLNMVREWSVPIPLTGNIFIFGRIGCLDENTSIFILEDNKILKKTLKELPNESINCIITSPPYW